LRPTAWAFSEDVLGRFAAYGWHTQRVDDGNDVADDGCSACTVDLEPAPPIGCCAVGGDRTGSALLLLGLLLWSRAGRARRKISPT
jgi:hypothetical protein